MATNELYAATSGFPDYAGDRHQWWWKRPRLPIRNDRPCRLRSGGAVVGDPAVDKKYSTPLLYREGFPYALQARRNAALAVGLGRRGDFSCKKSGSVFFQVIHPAAKLPQDTCSTICRHCGRRNGKRLKMTSYIAGHPRRDLVKPAATVIIRKS